MARTYRLNIGRRIVNRLITAALDHGIGPKRTFLLGVRGRRTGRLYETPVNLVYREGRRYLVSPYGNRGWARNARAAGKVSLRRGSNNEEVEIEEISGLSAGSVLKQYARENPLTRPFFDARHSASDEAFGAEADRHPVFHLVRTIRERV